VGASTRIWRSYQKLNAAAANALAALCARGSQTSVRRYFLTTNKHQTCAFQKAEIEKWWPIIKAANIKGEQSIVAMTF
jgi:hypothetical protein